MSVMDGIEAEMRRGAARAVVRAMKARARHYRNTPRALDVIDPTLSLSSPRRIIAIGEAKLEDFWRRPPHHIGFGGEVTAINAKAVILYGRYMRRFGERLGAAETREIELVPA